MKRRDERKQHCACEHEFEEKIENMVDAGTKPTPEEHEKKREEIRSALNKADDKK